MLDKNDLTSVLSLESRPYRIIIIINYYIGDITFWFSRCILHLSLNTAKLNKNFQYEKLKKQTRLESFLS